MAYKKFKITKRVEIAFHHFPKSAKRVIQDRKRNVYKTGIYKSTDVINGFDTYFFVVGTRRMMIYITHKNPAGASCG